MAGKIFSITPAKVFGVIVAKIFGIPMNLGGGGGESEYQEWSGYPDSPELTADFPWQCIFEHSNGSIYLVQHPTAATKMRYDPASDWRFLQVDPFPTYGGKLYILNDEAWELSLSNQYYYELAARYSDAWEFKEARVDIYNAAGDEVYFAKTT